jgi:hypothetical protein
MKTLGTHHAGEQAMIINTLDPVSLNDAIDTVNAPCLIEGEGDSALKVCFESGEHRLEYLAIPVHGSDGMSGPGRIQDAMAENPDTGSID